MGLESAIKVLETAAMPPTTETSPPPAESVPPVIEAAAPEVAVESAPVAEEKVAAKFAALAKKEKGILKRQDEMKAKEADILAKEKALLDKEAKLKEADSLWETDIFRALEMKGYDYNKLTQLFLSGERVAKKEPEEPAQVAIKQIEELKKQMADAEQKRIDEQKAAAEAKVKDEEARVEAAYNAYREEVSTFVETNADDYELIKIYGQHEMVVETVKAYYEQHKRALSVKEACDLTETYLVNEYKKAQQAKKFAAAKKAAEVIEELATKKTEPKSKTLTNNMMPTVASILPAATDAERMKRALQALESSQKA